MSIWKKQPDDLLESIWFCVLGTSLMVVVIMMGKPVTMYVRVATIMCESTALFYYLRNTWGKQ